MVGVGTDRSGVLDPPRQVSTVGWWRGGAALGEAAGSLVLVGHVDAESQGLGVLAALREVRPGQDVRVRGRDGRTVRYRITGSRTYPRDRALPASVFTPNVEARLVMITCTGAFDARTARYSDSLVVYAVPA